MNQDRGFPFQIPRHQCHAEFWLYLLAIVVSLSVWHVLAAGHFSLTVILALTTFSTLILFCGHLFLQIAPLSDKINYSFTLEFLCGYFIFNTSLFLISLVLPFGIGINVLVLSIIITLAFFFRWHVPTSVNLPSVNYYTPDFLCLLISIVGSTLWCSDALTPIVDDGKFTIFKTWQDSFFHTRQISNFAYSHGMDTISNISMAGMPANLYHYASYITPAALVALTGTDAYETFVSFYLPLGLFLTGLAAFSLVTLIWGRWPGVAAVVAVILLPDAYFQGFSNRLLSYNFMQQINPGGLYGVACIAIAWIFILDGCKTGKYRTILFGYIITVLSLFYKAHIFVANAFLILMYPCLFFLELKAKWRFFIGLLLIGAFILVVTLSQRMEGVPTLRLDGSSASSYVYLLLNLFDPGFVKSLFTNLFALNDPKPIIGFYAIILLMLSTFGYWSISTLALCYVYRNKTAPMLFFPLLIIINYLVMSLGLADDANKISQSYELQNRPMVWAYFAVVAWTSGALYYYIFGNKTPTSVGIRIATVLFLVLSLMIPFRLGQDLQTIPGLKGRSSFSEFNSFPSCLIKVAKYIRENSNTNEFFQDYRGDRNFLISAIAERQAYALSSMFNTREPKGLKERLDKFEELRRATDMRTITNFFSQQRISWYILHPDSEIFWPKSFVENPVFECNGYRVYKFSQ